MDQREYEEPLSTEQDQQVEISDLPDALTEARRWRGMRLAASLWQRRWLRLWVLFALSVLCLGVVLGSTPDIQTSLASAIFGETPTDASASPTMGLFFINPGPGWARLSIDGKALPRLPILGLDDPIQLVPGKHRVLWQAAPFTNQSCVISVPSSAADTCAIASTIYDTVGNRAWVISFTASLRILPAQARQNLLTSVQQALNQLTASELVYPGERFVDTGTSSGGPLNTARQPLKATLSLSLDSNQPGSSSCSGGDMLGQCKLDGQDCHAFCMQGNGSILQHTWNVVALVQTSWTYTTHDERIIAASMPDELGGAANLEHFLPLSITWDGVHWQTQAGSSLLSNDALLPYACASAEDAYTMNNDFGSSPMQSFGWQYISASNPAAGCLLLITSIASNGSSPSIHTPIAYLHRFGTTIALNHLAQAYNPEFPHPDAYELQLAQQLAAQAHVTLA